MVSLYRESHLDGMSSAGGINDDHCRKAVLPSESRGGQSGCHSPFGGLHENHLCPFLHSATLDNSWRYLTIACCCDCNASMQGKTVLTDDGVPR